MLSLVAAFLISFLLSIIVIHLSHKHTFFIDCHEEKKPQRFHEAPVPRAGGIGIAAGLLLLLGSSFGASVLLPTLLAFVSGIFEDFHNSLSVKVRLTLQFFAAFFAIWLTGAVVTYLGLGIHLPVWFGVLFSAFAIVGMMNAVNIIDGFNGLASGTILLILCSFLVTAYMHGNETLITVILVGIGAVLGFFVLVFPYGKIFLGDGGAYMLGFFVAILGIFLSNRYEDVSAWYILAVFIYPVWEVIFSIIRKLSKRYSPLKPDSDHFHMLVYRQVAKSNAKTAVIILLFISPFMAVSTYYAKRSDTNVKVVLAFIAAYVLFYLFLRYKEGKEKRV